MTTVTVRDHRLDNISQMAYFATRHRGDQPEIGTVPVGHLCPFCPFYACRG